MRIEFEVAEMTSSAWNGIGGFFRFMIKFVLIVVVIGVIGLGGFRVLFVNHAENYHYVYMWDRTTGETKRISRTGYIVSRPLLDQVHYVDGRPMQVCVSTIQRVLNCKLVVFTPDAMGVDEDGRPISGLHLFLKWHGRRDFQGGTPQMPTELNQLMMAYAYDGSGRGFPFIRVIDEIKPAETKK